METPDTGGPLRGLRVLELAAIGPAPFACMLLADLGADIVRVDRPGAPRAFGAWHRVLDRGRRSVALDLKNPAAADALLRLVEEADVLVEGYRPGVAERLGVGPSECLARNPRLVYGRMTGWGQDGPLAQEPGHDINYLALSGALDAIGRSGGSPVVPLNLLGDFAGGGLPLAFGVLAALQERERSGRGQVVDGSIVDGTAALLGMLAGMTAAGEWNPERGTNILDGGAPFYDTYACADGRYVAVGALEDRFYAALLGGLGLRPDELPDRAAPASWPSLRERFAACFATRTRDAWVTVFAGTEACVTPVLTLREAESHPHHRARGVHVGAGGVVQPAPVPRFGRTPAPPVRGSAPAVGAHTREVLAEVGLTESDLLPARTPATPVRV